MGNQRKVNDKRTIRVPHNVLEKMEQALKEINHLTPTCKDISEYSEYLYSNKKDYSVVTVSGRKSKAKNLALPNRKGKMSLPLIKSLTLPTKTLPDVSKWQRIKRKLPIERIKFVNDFQSIPETPTTIRVSRLSIILLFLLDIPLH